MTIEISDRLRRLGNEGGWIGVDLDGTLAHYDRWVAWNSIGEPIPLMVERVRAWIRARIEVKILTARVSGPHVKPSICRVTGQAFSSHMMKSVIQGWTERHIGERLDVTNQKDVNMIELWDDRAVQVIPNTGRTLAEEHIAALEALRGKQYGQD